MKRIYRSKTDSKIFGVCGGIGQTYDIDPTLVRLALVFFCLVTGILPLAITYFVAWLVIPERPPEQEG
ncbi:MAG: PspC domain-containing protein [Planctomycetota bacterium]|jgi:phage shock protein C